MRQKDARSERVAGEETPTAGETRSDRATATEVTAARVGRLRLDSPQPPTAQQPATPRSAFDYRTIRGILPTVLTPYDDHEQVDAEALQLQVKYLLTAGVHGLVVMGSIGEVAYLSDRDRDVIVRATVEAAGGRVPVVVGIAAASTLVAAEQMSQAQRLGAQAVMVCLQQYYAVRFDELRRHFERLSDLNALPIFYYHYPAATGLNLKPAQIAELLALANVVGIKESTFDLLAVKRHIELTRHLDRIYLSGSELTFVDFMALGGHGTVSTGAVVMPRTAAEMYEAYVAGDFATAARLQALLFETLPVVKDATAPVALARPAFLHALRTGVDIPLGNESHHARLKAALARRGIPIRPIVRSPLPQLTPRDERAVERAMKRIEEIEA